MSEPPRDGAAAPGNHDHGLVERQIQAINRFPDQNPHPVLRVHDDGQLTYANITSEPIRHALGVEVGDILLEDRFSFEPRGHIEVKGKGLMPTWFLTGRLTPPR